MKSSFGRLVERISVVATVGFIGAYTTSCKKAIDSGAELKATSNAVLSVGDGITIGGQTMTIGAVVTHNRNDSKHKFMLTNSWNKDPKQIRQAVFKTGTNIKVGEVFSWANPAETRHNALLVYITTEVSPQFRDGKSYNNNPIGRKEAEEMLKAKGQLRVLKYGNSSGWTYGVVESLSTTIEVLGTTMKDHVSIIGTDENGKQDGSRFAKDGDSGALVFEADSMRPLALLTSYHGDKRFYANKIDNVIKAMEISGVATGSRAVTSVNSAPNQGVSLGDVTAAIKKNLQKYPAYNNDAAAVFSCKAAGKAAGWSVTMQDYYCTLPIFRDYPSSKTPGERHCFTGVVRAEGQYAGLQLKGKYPEAVEYCLKQLQFEWIVRSGQQEVFRVVMGHKQY